MKRGNKIISILLAVCMLITMMTNIVFAEDVSETISWSTYDIGIFSFVLTDNVYDYRISLYKGSACIDEKDIHVDNAENNIINSDIFQYSIILNGTGVYKIEIKEKQPDGEYNTEARISPSYGYSDYSPKKKTLSKPIMDTIKNNVIKWTCDDENVKEYAVLCYIDNKGHYGKSTRCLISKEITSEKETILDNNIYSRYLDTMNKLYELNSSYYPKESSYMYVDVYAIPNDKTQYLISNAKEQYFNEGWKCIPPTNPHWATQQEIDEIQNKYNYYTHTSALYDTLSAQHTPTKANLYKNGEYIDIVDISISKDLGVAISKHGSGTYTFTLSLTDYNNNELATSDMSNEFVYIEPTETLEILNPKIENNILSYDLPIDNNYITSTMLYSVKEDGSLLFWSGGTGDNNSGFASHQEMDITSLYEKSNYKFMNDSTFDEYDKYPRINVVSVYSKNVNDKKSSSYTFEIPYLRKLKYFGAYTIIKSFYVKVGDPLPTIEDIPTKEGCKFIGWKDLPEAMPNKNIIIDALFEIADAPDFTIDNGAAETNSKTVTITFNDYAKNDFTQYKIGNDDYKDIDSNIISYELDKNDGVKDITITFKNDNNVIEKTHSITYNNKHNILYTVNNKVFKELVVGTGVTTPIMSEIPNVTGYRFDGWDKTTPETMPDEDIVINAKMTKISTVKGIVKLGDTPLENAAISIEGETATTNANGEYAIVVPCGEYMLTAKKDGMSKTVTVNAKDIETNVSEITLSAKSTNITFTEPTVKTVEGLDTLLENVISDEDATYLQTPGNTITVNAKAEPKAEDAEIGTALINTYSKYTAALYIDFTLEKVKGGAETTSDAITETDSLIAFKVAIPESIKDKAEFIILREHNGTVDALTTTPNADGEYIKVENGFITLYAKKFSTYALAGKDADPVVHSGGGGGSSSYTVKFETNGGSTLKSVSAKRYVAITEPTAPTKEGYTFDGWYSDKELTTKFDFTTKISKSITLYAKWTENAVKTSTIVLTIGEKSATINGETKENDVAPKIVNDRTMLPIRFIAESLGANVGWTEDTKTVTISAENTLISLVIGENFATVNGEKVELDSPSFIENDRTYLPIRFVSEKLGAKVDWDETAQTVTITK